jgi:hypothetical protein
MLSARGCLWPLALLLPGICTAQMPVRQSGTATPAIARITIEPPNITLQGPRAEARYVVTGWTREGVAVDLTPRAVARVASPAVAELKGGLLRPVADGASRLIAQFEGKQASAALTVKDAKARIPVAFSREVVPVLTKASCNSGPCHGAQHGKGGFRLSLTGFEPQTDYVTIAKQAGGRRALPNDPVHSLLLQKPAMQVAHQGGMKLPPGSPGYSLLAQWLREGAPGPQESDPEVDRLEVFPAERVLRSGEKQSVVVRAVYTDGQVHDVTRWARLGSLNDAIASLDTSGRILAGAPGETSIMVRFGGAATVIRITVPYAALARYPDFPQNNFIDGLVLRKWKALGLVPSGLADDATFLRRVHLDLIGTLPTAEEVRQFLADTAPDKRARLVDRLLERPEYADYWSVKWGDLLRSNRTPLGGPRGMWALTNWIREQLRDNKPIDVWVRELITAQGNTFTNGPANYFRVASNPNDLAETTSQVFLGLRMQCVKCHHHPFEKWAQSDYYRLAAFFARVGIKASNEFGLFGGDQVVRVNRWGEVHHPKTGAVMKPAPPGGYPESMKRKGPTTADLVDPDPDSVGDRRLVLAEWITRSNPLFARNIANRYWGYLMGRGLVEPIDDQRVTNPPSNPELLDALAEHLEKSKFDLKSLLRAICNSRVYQLSSEPTRENRRDTVFYTHARVKRIPAEVLLDAVNSATGTQEKFPDLPLGTRAIQLPDPQVASYFLDTFGRAPRVSPCECDRPAEPNMSQALHMMMGDLVNRKVQDGANILTRLIAAGKSDSEIIRELYLGAISRPPTAEEASRAEQAVRTLVESPHPVPARRVEWLPQVGVPRNDDSKARQRRAALEDLLWALLNSKEFMLSR